MTKASIRLRLAIVGAVLAALGTLTPGVMTRRARAFNLAIVTNTSDSGPGSLRDAIQNAGSGDTIEFNVSLPATITLTSGEIALGQNLTITGPGANLLTISGNNSSRIFNIASQASLILSAVTIANAHTSGSGGAILNLTGGLLASACTFTGNFGGNGGGAISSGGSLQITGCAFSDNMAPIGGAIYSGGATAIILNTTFNANSATSGLGGALELFATEDEVFNCTVAGNSAAGTSGGGGISLDNQAPLTLVNTILAGNAGGDCVNGDGTVIDNIHNLIQNGNCGATLSSDPKLGPLQNNGGQTPTMALLAGSPAIEAGADSVLGPPASLSTDQRGPGFPRKAGAHVDIGAFEFQSPPAPTFDACLKDNTTGNLIQWNSATGAYTFTRCSDGFTVSGTGMVGLVNGVKRLSDFKSDRRISAGLNTGQLIGSASIYLMVAQGVWQTFRIVDTNPAAVCACAG